MILVIHTGFAPLNPTYGSLWIDKMDEGIGKVLGCV